MSFGGGGFGGFGSNNTQQSTGFGGFGSTNNNTSGGFGSGGFGSSNNTGGSIFGGGSTSGGFGGGGGGFGSNTTSSPFGAKPAFGASTTSTSGGSLFGGGTATSGSTGFGGGFGGGATPASTGFGGGNTAGGGLFGQQNKPAFGASTTANTGGGLFGGSGNAPGTTSSAFGAGGATAFGGGLNQATNNGTAGTPFQAHVEKDGATSQNAHYQTITFQQPYQGFSLEELRLQDYAQGRRYGNANGQAGAFGASTGFGSFGSSNNSNSGGFGANNTNTTSGGMFGSNTSNTSTPFGGAQQNTSGGFGGNTSGGLFGAKPATGGGLFGSNTASSGQSSGGLFGTSGGSTGTSAFGGGAASGGFGSNTPSAGGGLFGQNNQQQQQPQQQQNKPFGGFGSNTGTGFGASTTGTGGGFGSNTSTGGGLFGGGNTSTTTSAFGGNQQPQQQNTSNPFGGFGQNQQNQAQSQPPGGGLFGGGFGQNNQQQSQQQNKPLFGASTGGTGGGLFGGGQQQQNQTGGGGLFGGNNQQQQPGGGLFGAKPAGTTGGLFGGSTNTNTNTGGGLFGGLGQGQNSQQQNQAGGGLFGAKPAGTTGGLFGASTNPNTNTGGGLFGGALGQQNNASSGLGGGLFGGQQSNQQQQPAPGGSLFGGSMAQQSINQAPQLTASMNVNPYGNDQLFASLNSPSQSVGPLATPLSSSQKQKKSAILPQHRINPAASTRMITPQKRVNGYGFSYSTYGTPGSAMGSGSPNLSGSLIGGGSFSKSLSKSFSTSSLRTTWNAEDSILSPGAFNPSKRPAYANTGSMKRLNIDRALNVRPSLFGDDNNHSPASQKKRVSFDASTTLNGSLNGTNGALVPAESTTPSAEEQGFLRSSRSSEKETNGVTVNGDQPEMEQVKGNELAIVPEEQSPHSVAKQQLKVANEKARKAQKDQIPGEYWSEPSLDQLKKMSKQELKSLSGFRVGREGIGEIQFEHPVDLTGINLDDLYDKTVILKVRNATVYPSKTSTPPQGKGLNVPSLILLENSWPRAAAGKFPVHDKAGPRFQKHIERLKKVEGTEFVDYDAQTGTWKFRVQHYTTYELVYDDEEEDTMLSDAPTDMASPTPMARGVPAPLSTMSRATLDDSMVSPAESSPDDTFDFKRGLVKRNNVPGSFDAEDGYYDDDMVYGQDETLNSTQSFLDERSVGPYEAGSDMDDAASYRSGSDSEPEHTMAGSFPIPDRTTEQTPAKNTVFDASGMPKSILKASRAGGFGTPSKGAFDFEGDWAAQLQRTISPKKQDRQTLRETQNDALRQFDEKNDDTPKASTKTNKPFSNSIDLMNSLFGQSTARRTATAAANGSPVRKKGKGLEWPYQKRPKTGDDLDELNDADKAFHDTFKPSWASDGTLTYTAPGNAPQMQNEFITNLKNSIVGQHTDVRFAKFSTPDDIWPATIVEQAQAANTHLIDGTPEEPPRAETLEMDFATLANVVAIDTQAGRYEQQVWKLASILFDNVTTELPDGLPQDVETYEHQIRTMKLGEFWKSIVLPDVDHQARLAKTAEEKALARLSSHSIAEACDALIEGKDFRLATLLAQIGGPLSSKAAIAAQIEEWRAQNVLSEISDAIRALYAILSGEFAVADGAAGPAAENKASDVRISSRFGLDWRQAFGLRLWYSRTADTDDDGLIEYAVQRFEDELREGDEDARPVPWFVRAGVKTGWDDPTPNERQDLLWGLLKLYKAYRKNEMTFSVASVLAPENATGNPVNARLSWQLLTLLRAKNILPREVVTSDMEYDGPREGELWNAREITELSDALTQTFSLPLLTEQHWTHATWVLIHHTDDAVRATAIKDIIAFNAGNIGEDAASDATFAHLTTHLRIAPSWIYAAKALHARAVLGDAVKEVQYLLSAESYATAHEVLCRAVAPAAVIANTAIDLNALYSLLEGFADAPEKDLLEWTTGGQVYADYIALLQPHHDPNHGTSPATTPSQRGAADERLLHRLSAALASLAPQLGTRDVMERAALKEIARAVLDGVATAAAAAKRDQQQHHHLSESSANGTGLDKDRRNVLRMGVTEEASLRLGREVGIEYYRNVIAGGAR